jgi:hypothetical protein
MKHVPVPSPALRSQAGGGMLTFVAMLGVLLIVVQGGLYYKAKGSAKFLGSEKTKVQALQLAEAGVEDNIADLGRRSLRIRSGLIDTVTYAGKAFGGGSYTTRLTTVGTGAASDTVDLVSTGSVGRGSQTVRARMKLRKLIDTSRTPRIIVKPETTLTLVSRTVSDTSRDTTLFNPNSVPQLDLQTAWIACMNSTQRFCEICHLPPGNNAKTIPQSHNKNSGAIRTHIAHHGDYVSTDGTCDLFDPKVTIALSYRLSTDTTLAIVDKTTYDTSVVIDTVVKVQILSWR